MYFFKKKMCLLIFRESEDGRKNERQRQRERERNKIDAREKHQLVASRVRPDLGSKPQHRYVP